MQPVTIKASEQFDTRWVILTVLLCSVPLLIFSGGWLLLGLLPVVAGIIHNVRLVASEPAVDLVRSQSGRWHVVRGSMTEEVSLKAHWRWPHVLFLQWLNQQGRTHHRIILRHQLQAVRYSKLMAGLQQDNIKHDKQNSGQSR